MSEDFPVLPPDGGEELFFANAWRSGLPQTLGDTSCFNPDAQPNAGENLIVMKLTLRQLTEMFSALYIGAEFCYPEKYLEVIRPLLAATSCPPILEEQECFDYPTYASFMRYAPMNPYVSPDEIPDGYATEPFIVNGENGNSVPNYEHFDVLVPSAAITLDLNWFETLNGQLPTIEIMVQGAGTALVKMLTLAQGGLAVITLDNPPDLLDIIGGIVTSGENIIDLNQDLVSLPPETAQELVFPVEITGSGLHTIYIVFLPILDDSLIPVRFGGGFRGVTLCDFIPDGTMGITNLRFVNCNLEQQIDGVWSVVNGWEDWLDCVPSGGGGGMAAIDFDVQRTAFSPDQTFTNTAFANFADGIANFNLTAKGTMALVICDNISASNGVAANEAAFRLTLGGNVGLNSLMEASVTGTAAREIQVCNYWDGLTVGASYQIRLQRKTNAGTATLQAESPLNWTIIWANDASQLFVEDIRIVGRELQKKIGGAWITVTDSLATILNGIETIANNAAAAAAAAQASANSAQNTANGAVTVNNQQNVRLNNLEADVNQINNVDIPQINLILDNHEARITALENAVSTDNSWAGYKFGNITHAVAAPGLGYSSPTNVFQSSSPAGWLPDAGNQVDIRLTNGMRYGSSVHVRITVEMLVLSNNLFYVSVNDGEEQVMVQSSTSGNHVFAWLNVPAIPTTEMKIVVRNSLSNQSWVLDGVTILFLVINPLTGVILP